MTLDDVGTDQIRAYDPSAPACTPFLDDIAAAGVKFSRGYAMPVCSPTRAAWLTGKYSIHSGIGNAVKPGSSVSGWGLQLSELTLAEHLKASGFATWCVGKWHLDGTQHGPDHPNLQGFDTYRGAMGGGPGNRMSLPPSYTDWEYTVDGVTTTVSEHTTNRMALDALEMVHRPQPWYGEVQFNQAHFPYHVPPLSQTGAGCLPLAPSGLPGNQYYPDMIQSADFYMRLIVEEAVRATGGNLVVIVWGDNGTPTQVPAKGACPKSGKGLLYEGGIRVPLLVAGVGVTPGIVSHALVHPSDLFATVCELVGVSVAPEAQDSVSFFGALSGGPGLRDHVYLDYFRTNGEMAPGPFTQHRRTVVEEHWKLIRRYDSGGLLPIEELFDLQADPCEQLDLLLAPLSPDAQAAYDRLEDRLFALGAG